MIQTTLCLVRHGETEWSLSGAHTGKSDILLTQAGRAAAKRLGEYLADRKFDLVLTSPRKRARETCEIAGFAAMAEIDDRLSEWDYGLHEGRTTHEIRTEFPGWSLWEHGVPNGETIEQVADRARQVIERCSRVEGTVALFAHGHILRVLTACWLDLPARDARRFALSTASVSTLGHEHETRVITTWNYSLAKEL